MNDENKKFNDSNHSMLLIVFLVGAVIAASMSWKCSTLWKRKQSTKIFWAFVAGLGNWGYVLINYWIMNWDTCSKEGLVRFRKRVEAAGNQNNIMYKNIFGT